MTLYCPISQREIEDAECANISDVVNGMLKETFLNPELINNPDYVNICKKCQNESGCIFHK